MAQKIDLVFNDSKARALRSKIKGAFNGAAQDAPVRYAAEVWRGRLIRRTPKRWTGQTRRSWQVQKIRASTFELTNTSKVMGWLERGTKAHGPVRAKRLFIPLTRKAAIAGARGVFYALRLWRLNQTFGSSAAKKKPPFIMFHDFVLAKRVKGIKPMWVVRSAREQARNTLRLLMRDFVIRRLK